MKNGNAHTSISIDVVARVANVFLERASRVKNEEFFPWDGDDVVGVCINLIDQVTPPWPAGVLCLYTFVGAEVNGRDMSRDRLRWRGGF
jgi:hypothetical protein